MTFAAFTRKIEGRPVHPPGNPLKDILDEVDWDCFDIDFEYLDRYVNSTDVDLAVDYYDSMFSWLDFDETIYVATNGEVNTDYGGYYGRLIHELPDTERYVLEYLYEKYCR